MAENELTESEEQFFETGGEAEIDEPVAEAAEEPADEPAAETDGDIEEADDRKVPYGAMHEERQRRKEESAARQAAEQRAQRMEERFQQMLAMQQQPHQQEEPLPDFDEDPAEYLRRTAEQTGATVQQLQNHIQQQQAQQQHAYQRDQFIYQYKGAAQQYAKTNPDFTNAYQSLLKGRISEYKAAGYDEQEAMQFVEQDELAIAAKAFQDGVNPAERIVELAKVRGWTVEREAELKKMLEIETGAENVDRIRRGQAAGKSLSGSAGKREGALTLESLAEMDDDEFAEKWDSLIGVKKSVLG